MDHDYLIKQFHTLRLQVADAQVKLEADPDNADLQTDLDNQNQQFNDILSQLQQPPDITT